METPSVPLRVLELFSGIGGMHAAFERTGIPFTVVQAVDINPMANAVYDVNFGDRLRATNANICALTVATIERLAPDIVTLSPPCQPFTRTGKRRDMSDHRSEPLLTVLRLLPALPASVRYLLLENVKGFERSDARELLVAGLTEAGFRYQEYMLSPHQYGMPNTRHRYYCLARRDGRSFRRRTASLVTEPDPRDVLPGGHGTIGDYLDREEADVECNLTSETIRSRLEVMDVCTAESRNSMCFTRAYRRYQEGTGSVYTALTRQEFDARYAELAPFNRTVPDDAALASLRLRYFTPREVARLMAFPEGFLFPPEFTFLKRYRVLGNSVNVLVVSSLLRELLTDGVDGDA